MADLLKVLGVNIRQFLDKGVDFTRVTSSTKTFSQSQILHPVSCQRQTKNSPAHELESLTTSSVDCRQLLHRG